MLLDLRSSVIAYIIAVFVHLVERILQISLRSQKFHQFGFCGIAPECLIDIPRSCFIGNFCFHDDHILRPVQAQGLGQQFGHITVQTIEVPHPAHIARGEASHTGVQLTQVTRCRHRCTLFGTGADGLADLTVQLHLRQVLADCIIQGGIHSTVVNVFSDIHRLLLSGAKHLVDVQSREKHGKLPRFSLL